MLDAAGVTDAAERERLDGLLAVDHEVPAIIHALDGGYIRPAPGGDLLRTTEVLPTGRNLHGFDPFRIPSAFAVRDGARQADRLLARHQADSGALPETVAMVLWGTDNLKTEGGPIAQALWLLGAEPRMRQLWPGFGCASWCRWKRLGRPRIDVDRDPVRHLPRSAAVADETSCRGRAAGRHRRRTGRAEFRPHARPGVPGRAWRHDRGCGAAGVRQCRRRLWRQRQPACRQRHLERRRRTRRRLPEAQGLCLRRRPASRGGTTRCWRTRWRGWTSPTRTSIRSKSASPPSIITSIRSAASAERCGGRAADRRPRFISATRRAATARCARSPNRSRWKPARGR